MHLLPLVIAKARLVLYFVQEEVLVRRRISTMFGRRVVRPTGKDLTSGRRFFRFGRDFFITRVPRKDRHRLDGDGEVRHSKFQHSKFNLSYPILEYDPSTKALIEPGEILKKIDAPERCVFCFFQEVITRLKDEGKLKVIFETGSEIGKNPVYELEHKGERIALFHPGVGAPLAGAFLEEVIALGCRKFIAIGSAGVLDGSIHLGHLIVPTSAVRDEGTSYHYLPPSREVEPDSEVVAAIIKTLEVQNIPYSTGKTWTTDGFYRETPARIKHRREEGCITVEMEAAAFFAVAKFRGVQFGQILYGGDDVSGEEWDHRQWHSRREVRWGMLELALETVGKV